MSDAYLAEGLEELVADSEQGSGNMLLVSIHDRGSQLRTPLLQIPTAYQPGVPAKTQQHKLRACMYIRKNTAAMFGILRTWKHMAQCRA